MKGQVALVTGADGGLGTSVTQAFLDAHATVVGTSRKIRQADFNSADFTAVPAEISTQTGATSQMLAARLKRLEADGLIERHPYSERPPRHEYRLTPKGVDLMPVILALRAWGERWCKPEGGQPATRMFHRACGSELELDGNCPTCGGLVSWTDMRGQPSQAYADERARRAAEFTDHRRDPATA